MKRPSGHASVEEHPKGSGLYRVRARVGKKRPVLGKNLSRAAADELANGYAAVRAEESVREGLQLESFGEGFFFRRKRKGVRGWKKDQDRWNKHVARNPIGKLAVSTISRRDIVDWVDGLPGSHRSRVRNLNLLRVALQDAVERELLPANPARDVRVHRAGAAASKDDLEGILNVAEQQALLSAIPTVPHWALVLFALVTGLRQAELYWLKWEDVGTESIIVRRSVGGLPPKSGKPREVPLLQPARIALGAVARGRNPFVFHGLRGARRQDGKPPLGWNKWVEAAGITRKIRWHDLRHTCATSLIAGWWGRKWDLREVQMMLGHSSITMTERYARRLQETLKTAALLTPGFVVPGVAKKELTVRNPLVRGAFVKRRSQVQIQQSAPGVDAPRLGPDCGQTEDSPRSSSAGRAPRRITSEVAGSNPASGTICGGWLGPLPPPVVAQEFPGLREAVWG